MKKKQRLKRGNCPSWAPLVSIPHRALIEELVVLGRDVVPNRKMHSLFKHNFFFFCGYPLFNGSFLWHALIDAVGEGPKNNEMCPIFVLLWLRMLQGLVEKMIVGPTFSGKLDKNSSTVEMQPKLAKAEPSCQYWCASIFGVLSI